MRILVAGLGNIFDSDDGFGVELAQRLSALDWPPQVEVTDFGIRGVHLAYQLLDGYDLVVIADAVDRGAAPGTLFVLEHGADPNRGQTGLAPPMDAHDLSPDGVLALVPRLGGTLPRVAIVGCQPATVAPGIGLSAPVAGSLDDGVALVTRLVQDSLGESAAVRTAVEG